MFVRCSCYLRDKRTNTVSSMNACVCLCFCLWISGTRGKRCVYVCNEDREKVSDFPSSSVLSPRSPAVANSQPVTWVLSLALTQTHMQLHKIKDKYTNTDICSHPSLNSLWKSSRDNRAYKERARSVRVLTQNPEGLKWGGRLVGWFVRLRSTGGTALQSLPAGEGLIHREIYPHTGFCHFFSELREFWQQVCSSRSLKFELFHCKMCWHDKSM